MRQLGFTPTYEDVQTYLFAFDRGRGKQVTFSSLCDIIKSYMQDNNPEVFEQTLVEAFRVFDNEQEGYVNTSVIRNMLLMLPEIVEPKDVEHLLREMDENGEGYISYESFVSTLCEMYKEGLNASADTENEAFRKEEVKEFFAALPVEGRDDGEDNPEMVAEVLAEARKKREEAKAKRRERRKALKESGSNKGKRKLRKKKKKTSSESDKSEGDGSEEPKATEEEEAERVVEEAKRKVVEAVTKKKKLSARLKARRAATVEDEEEEEGIEMAHLAEIKIDDAQ